MKNNPRTMHGFTIGQSVRVRAHPNHHRPTGWGHVSARVAGFTPKRVRVEVTLENGRVEVNTLDPKNVLFVDPAA